MAKKSKTQRAKASASRSAKKEQQRLEEAQGTVVEPKPAAAETEEKKIKVFAKKSTTEASKDQQTKEAKKDEKPKKEHFKFLKEVRTEMKRVTWPSKQDVVRWSGVVVVALLFFGVFVALLDNVIITPLLVAISGLGA